MLVTTTLIWALKSPKIAHPAYETVPLKERWISLGGFLPTALIIIAVLGRIYGGGVVSQSDTR
jgi:hypothetical protein